ncbi:MAG: prepilin-type N-terminal cleavage/methylation domain-containing protein [Patescibacteria group bacterium]
MSLLRTNKIRKVEAGFSLIELVIAMTLIGIITTILYTVFNNNFSQFMALQTNNVKHGELSTQSQRMGSLIRGLTDITAATSSELTFYAYLSPRDDTVSLIRYYKSTDGTKLHADVTPMSANPPTGTPITSDQKTITLLDNFYTVSGVNLFTYLDSAGNTLTTPITDLRTIKGVKTTLAVANTVPVITGNETVSVQVSLRNRKSNL